MKRISLITASLLALGLISTASASSTFGTTNVVYISGSTAFRPNLFNTLTNTVSTPSVFDAGSVVVTPTSATSSTSQYNVVGTISGVSYCVSVSLTGSEAGIDSLLSLPAITYTVPADTALGLTGTTVTLAGTPLPTFLDPGTGAATVTTQTPDLAFADTSFAVSLNSAHTPAPVEYGIVGCIPFTWAKGKNTAPDSSWTDLTDLSTVTFIYGLTTAQPASFFTGKTGDTDKVYLFGRNEGSGTRVNTLCDLNKTIGLNSVSQYAVNNATYVNTVLTASSTFVQLNSTSLAKNTTPSHLVSVGGDGFDSGSGVQKSLDCDIHGTALVTIGYMGLADATTAVANGAVLLTLDGQSENDGNVISGAYHFWGHEHLYGNPSITSAGTTVAQQLVGTGAANTKFSSSWSTTGSAIEAHGGMGNNTTPGNQDTAIDGAAMLVDKPTGGDFGYPSLF